MGRGNTCVRGKYEGLYYVDNDYIDCYDKDGEIKLLGDISDLRGWDYDYTFSRENFEEFLYHFCEDFRTMFPSFEVIQMDYCGTIMKNNLFEIVIEDNEWSYAVKLIQLEEEYDEYHKEGFQKKHYQNYLNGIKKCLFNQFPELGIYDGPWTSGRIYREENVA